MHNQEAYERAQSDIRLVAAELVGYIAGMLKQGHIAPAFQKSLSEYIDKYEAATARRAAAIEQERAA